jgi:hypothetical protein
MIERASYTMAHTSEPIGLVSRVYQLPSMGEFLIPAHSAHWMSFIAALRQSQFLVQRAVECILYVVRQHVHSCTVVVESDAMVTIVAGETTDLEVARWIYLYAAPR